MIFIDYAAGVLNVVATILHLQRNEKASLSFAEKYIEYAVGELNCIPANLTIKLTKNMIK